MTEMMAKEAGSGVEVSAEPQVVLIMAAYIAARLVEHLPAREIENAESTEFAATVTRSLTMARKLYAEVLREEPVTVH